MDRLSTVAGDDLFISGGDLKEFHGITSAKEAEQMARRMGTILKRIEQLPCWTIAAINGAIYGGGWEIMLAFDFRIASTKASFHFSQESRLNRPHCQAYAPSWPCSPAQWLINPGDCA